MRLTSSLSLKRYILEKGRKEFKIIKIITAMKKKIFILLASLCIAILFAINLSINFSNNKIQNTLVLENIEALARGETPGGPHAGESCVVEGTKNIEWGNLKITCINNCTGMSYFSSIKKTSICL